MAWRAAKARSVVLSERFKFVSFILIVLLASLVCVSCKGGSDGSSLLSIFTSSGSEASGVVGSDGGSVEVTDPDSDLYGARVEIPAGALSEEQEISISKASTIPEPPNDRFQVQGSAVTLEPSGLTFNKPVTVELPYGDDHDETVDTLVVLQYDQTSQTWYIPTLSRVDLENNKVSALVSHFSIFELSKREEAASGESIAVDNFTFESNTFNISNGTDDLAAGSCDEAAWGFASYAKWYFDNSRTPVLKQAYSETDAAEIACKAQSAESSTGEGLLEKLNDLGTLLDNADAWTLDQVRTALEVENSPQVIGMTHANTGARHAVLAYEWDADQNILQIYDPNNSETNEGIHYNANNSRFDDFGDYQNFRYLGSQSLIADADLELIFEEYYSEPTSVPAAPTDVAAEAGDQSATLSWKSGNADFEENGPAESYNIYYSTSSGLTTTQYDNKITGASSPYEVTGLTNGVTYYFIVTGVNSAGEGEASGVVAAAPFEPETAPSAPVNVMAEAGDQKVTLTWASGDEDLYRNSPAESYNIYYSETSGVTAANYDQKITDATSPREITGLTNGVTYYFIVTGVNATGEGEASTEVSAEPLEPISVPSAPIDVTAGAGDQKVTLTWASGDEDLYRNSPAESYNIYYSDGSGLTTTDYDQKITNAASPREITGLTNGVTYYFIVTGVNSAGEGEAGEEVSTTPNNRFTDNGNGTVTDNKTGLIWLKSPDCLGTMEWADAIDASNALAEGSCGLTDGSDPGDWRMPNRNEYFSLLDFSQSYPAISPGYPFTELSNSWTSTTDHSIWTGDYAWGIVLTGETPVLQSVNKSNDWPVWPVRGETSSHVELPVYKTGQAEYSWRDGDDGDLQKGVGWPTPRFTGNLDGTVTDNLTKLVWLKHANCKGQLSWYDAMDAAAGLADGECNLDDGSAAGDWRLPTFRELQTLQHLGFYNPAVPNGMGDDKWSEGDAFNSVMFASYWTSTEVAADTTRYCWLVDFYEGKFGSSAKTNKYYVWPVRDAN